MSLEWSFENLAQWLKSETKLNVEEMLSLNYKDDLFIRASNYFFNTHSVNKLKLIRITIKRKQKFLNEFLSNQYSHIFNSKIYIQQVRLINFVNFLNLLLLEIKMKNIKISFSELTQKQPKTSSLIKSLCVNKYGKYNLSNASKIKSMLSKISLSQFNAIMNEKKM